MSNISGLMGQFVDVMKTMPARDVAAITREVEAAPRGSFAPTMQSSLGQMDTIMGHLGRSHDPVGELQSMAKMTLSAMDNPIINNPVTQMWAGIGNFWLNVNPIVPQQMKQAANAGMQAMRFGAEQPGMSRVMLQTSASNPKLAYSMMQLMQNNRAMVNQSLELMRAHPDAMKPFLQLAENSDAMRSMADLVQYNPELMSSLAKMGEDKAGVREMLDTIIADPDVLDGMTYMAKHRDSLVKLMGTSERMMDNAGVEVSYGGNTSVFGAMIETMKEHPQLLDAVAGMSADKGALVSYMKMLRDNPKALDMMVEAGTDPQPMADWMRLLADRPDIVRMTKASSRAMGGS